MDKLRDKLREKSGADGSTEKTGWIIIAVIVVALAITAVKKFAPEFTEMVTNKLKDFLNLATVS